MADIEAKEGNAGAAKRATTDAALSAPQAPDRLDAEELDRREAAKLPQRRAAGPPKDEDVPEDAEIPDVPATEVEES